MKLLVAVLLLSSFTLVAAPARATGKVHASSATLTIAEDGRAALHDALRVLGKPTEQWKITDKDDVAAGPVDVVTFAQKGRKTIALYFYGGKFVQLAEYNPAQRPPKIRSDHKTVAAGAGDGSAGAYTLSGRPDAVTVRAEGGAPAPSSSQTIP